MVHTAIIAFTIILMMLLFTSNKKEPTKIPNTDVDNVTENVPKIVALQAQLVKNQELLNIKEKKIKMYEANLTHYKNKEKVLIKKINTFPSKIDELIAISEEISKKAESEFNKLLSKNKVLENNLTDYAQSDNEQKAKIITLIAKNKELEEERVATQKAAAEAKAKENHRVVSEIQ